MLKTVPKLNFFIKRPLSIIDKIVLQNNKNRSLGVEKGKRVDPLLIIVGTESKMVAELVNRVIPIEHS